MKEEMNQTAVDSYLPATEVGRNFGYTKDYILMLIKQGKIDGVKIKNKWHADQKSARVFFENAKIEREQRRKRLSASRKAELLMSQKSQTFETAQNQNGGNTATQVVERKDELEVVSSDSAPIRTPLVTPSRVAVLQTALVLFLGVSVGMLGYLGTKEVAIQTQKEFGFFERMAISVNDLFSPVSNPHTILTATKQTDEGMTEHINTNIASVALSMQISTTTHTSIIIDTDEVVTTTTIDTIEDSVRGAFSDDVEVMIDPEDEDAVLVTPKFIDGDGETQRFRIVPEDYEAKSNNE